MRLLASANVLLLLAACGRADDESAQVSSVDQLEAASPDSAMKQRWREAAAKGQLPPFDSLPAIRTRVSTRTPAQVVDSPRTATSPTIQQGIVATVRAFSRQRVDRFDGPFMVTDTTASSITGTLPGRTEPFELQYKLPDTARLVQIVPNVQHRLRVRDEVENQSLRRELILGAPDRALLLAYVNDGGTRPYTKRFEPFPFSVAQRAPGADSVASVTVTLGGETTTVRPGQRASVTVGGVPFGIFVQSSVWTPADRVETAEGDAYHVTLMVYRLRRGAAPGG